MAFRDTWHRALVYFGLAEDPEYAEDAYEPDTGQHAEVYDAPSTAPPPSAASTGAARGTRSTTSSRTTSRPAGAPGLCGRCAATAASTCRSTWSPVQLQRRPG